MTTTAVRVPLGLVVVLGALSSFGPLALDLYLPGLPGLARDLDAPVASAQLSLSLCMIGLAVGQLLVGPVTDRVGRRIPLIVGVAAFAATAALCAISPTIEVLLVLRLLGGLAGGAGLVIARAMVRDLYDGATAARVFALLLIVSSVAPIIAPLAGGALLRVTDWRGVFGVLAAFGLVLLVAAVTRRETLPRERRSAAGLRLMVGVLRAVVRDARFLRPALVLGVGMCGMFAYIAMGSFVLQGSYGLDAQSFSFVFGANSVGILLFGRASALLVGRVGPRRLLAAGIVIGLLAAVALLVGVLVSTSVWAVLPPLFVHVACVGLIAPNGTALALADQGERAGTASAVVGLSQFFFAAVVPPLASLGGVTPVVLAVTILGTAVVAGVVQFGVRVPPPGRTVRSGRGRRRRWARWASSWGRASARS